MHDWPGYSWAPTPTYPLSDPRANCRYCRHFKITRPGLEGQCGMSGRFFKLAGLRHNCQNFEREPGTDDDLGA